jgi:hypothetical protein
MVWNRRDARESAETLDAYVRRAARPLTGPADLDPLLERIGDARFVLLGEASHGTSEFYTWRGAHAKGRKLGRGVSIKARGGARPASFSGYR